ncbi:MAG: ATP-binding cassette domain-containing protein, partial [Lentisphaerae bacterium]|nr:ATP-binding cassette domain-containing protein [Lentisphaerota bacterium]
MNTLYLENITAGYGDYEVVKKLSLQVDKGEFTAILGPNGAGKSTLFKIMTGLLLPSAGQVQLFGRDIHEISAKERAQLVGVAPQEFSTSMPYSVEEIVQMGRTATLNPWKHMTRTDRVAVEKAMAYTDVIDFRDRLFDELSGGERQRTVMAMVLAQQPRLILMDEPTSHLDINHRIEIMQIMERINSEKETTILMISHDINLTSEFCRRIIILKEGAIVADGTPIETLREDTLKRVYHCDMRVRRDDETGSVTVLPARRFTKPNAETDKAVHVICGGGSGQDIIRRLSLAGYTVTCGVLNEFDTDTQVAEAFGAKTAMEKPFSCIERASLEQALELAKSADTVVLAEVAFGPGNLANLEIAEQALDAGKRVVV